jgi:hypothetical protein
MFWLLQPGGPAPRPTGDSFSRAQSGVASGQWCGMTGWVGDPAIGSSDLPSPPVDGWSPAAGRWFRREGSFVLRGSWGPMMPWKAALASWDVVLITHHTSRSGSPSVPTGVQLGFLRARAQLQATGAVWIYCRCGYI